MSPVATVIANAIRHDGVEPLSDQLAADLRDGVGTTITADGGFAHVSPRAGAWTTQIVVDPAARTADRAVARRLVADVIDHVASAGGGRLDWWVSNAETADDDVARDAGMTVGRTLHQMRRPLPADERASIETRGFRPGVDDEAWVTVNNRSFAGHPEQGGWTVDTFRRRAAAEWFDPDGLRIHEIDGQIAAFCWTKVHPPSDEGVDGEIYVIGVDPDFQGRGLGRQLTLAGLDWLTDHGIRRGLLYVDGDNAAAVGLYDALGFTITRTDRAYVIEVEPTERAEEAQP